MQVYLDNIATTKPYKEVISRMASGMEKYYANPSSMYSPAIEVDKQILNARRDISTTIRCGEKEIYFTSGGTESNNIALKGISYALKSGKNHIITSKIEHPSVLNTAKSLMDAGFEVTFVDCDENGVIDADKINEAVKNETALISIMAVNNEVGSVQPIKKIGQVAKSKGVPFHVDAVQAFMKIPIDVNEMNIDFMSTSAHKIHGPKGIGFLYKRDSARILPLMEGGGQQSNLRSGTENTPGIIGFDEAVKISYRNMKENIMRMKALKRRLWDGIQDIDDAVLNGPDISGGNSAPHILNVSFLGTRGETVLHSLEGKGIYVSTGSACSSHKKGLSHVLKSMGLSDERILSAVRFGFTAENTAEEIDYTVDALKDVVKECRKFYRR